MQMLRFIWLVVGSDAIRTSGTSKTADLASDGQRMAITNLYTFGAPKMATGGGLSNPLREDGCFPGKRIVTKDSGMFIDLVPPLLRLALFYSHTKGDSSYIYHTGKVEEHSCGWMGDGLGVGWWGLHAGDKYWRWTAKAYPEMKPMVSTAMHVSYWTDWKKTAQFVADQGYGLVASAVCLELDEVAHLIQNPDTMDCWLTFEGSDNGKDWWNNIQIWTTDFCGLKEKVHTGFKKSTMAIINEWSFQAYVRPNLGHCRTVDVLGHSLGGSIAGLFSACAHSDVKPGQKGYEDFDRIWIEKKEPKRMPYIVEP